MPRTFRALLGAVVVLALTLGLAPSAGATTTSAAPIAFPTTDGDLLSAHVFKVGATSALAIGGNFTNVVRANGTKVPARNFAVLRLPDGAVLFTGNVNSYVRAIQAAPGRLYIGGDFTSVAGHARNRVASFDTATWALTRFNPPNTSRVWALAWSELRQRVFVGTSTAVFTSPRDGIGIGTLIPASQGPVRALLLYPSAAANTDWLFVCGLFEKIGGLAQHGLAKLLLAPTGITADRVFAPRLRPDSGTGPRPGDDGQACLSLAPKQPDMPLLVGWGGASTNGVMALNQITGSVWWTHGTGTAPGTPGDAQAVASYGAATWVGYHRNHINDTAFPWRWYGSQLVSNTGALSSWDPGLSGNTGSNIDGGNGGITALQVDTTNRLLIIAGGFTTYGRHCIGTVYPCTGTGGTPRRSLALYRVTP